MSYCWCCGGVNCTEKHDEELRRGLHSYCQRCGKHGESYECQDCLELVCWECGLKGAEWHEPDTGYYICGACAAADAPPS